MAWKARLTANAEHDLEAINDFLFQTHRRDFGHDIASADHLADTRLQRILENIQRIIRTPHIGVLHTETAQQYRHVTFDWTVYWYRTDDVERIISTDGIFLDKQDHFSRFMNRLTNSEGEAG